MSALSLRHHQPRSAARPSAPQNVLVAALVLATGCAGGTPAGSVPEPGVFAAARGAWDWAYRTGACSDNPHTVQFPNRSEMLLTFRVPFAGADSALDREARYDIQAVTDSTIRGFLHGESRRTDAGELVVWDLVLLSPDVYCWHRTDWSPGGCTLPIVRCPAGLDSAAHVPRDTVRYRETTYGNEIVESPRGRLRYRTEHDAVIVVGRWPNDMLRAWYERLRLRHESPDGVQEPATDSVLESPFTLRAANPGLVETVAPPNIPPPMAAITDLRQQFQDFWISVPGGELTVGSVWSDTVFGFDLPSPPGVRHFRVERDTIVDGAAAIVVSVRRDLTRESSEHLDDGETTVHIHLQGEERGFAIVDVATRSLVARERSADLTGEVRVVGRDGQPVVMPYTRRYWSTITRLRPER